MARPLADFQGELIYLDTNILVGLVDADSVYHSSCAAFFRRALDPTQPIQLVTCTLTLDEVVFVLLQELIAKPLYNVSRSRSQYLQDHPDVVKALMEQLDPLIEALFDLLLWEPVTPADIRQMRHEMRMTGVLPRCDPPCSDETLEATGNCQRR
ncbi:MAG TPA: type II toxin-antitoxin system VapC family toxin [Methylomirabilota bacterium]|jgi:predicted nucleic acid-binding protein|nr:type II toxin-antitoxin system VapC family toxin [Methylomirabilota bacterium]